MLTELLPEIYDCWGAGDVQNHSAFIVTDFTLKFSFSKSVENSL